MSIQKNVADILRLYISENGKTLLEAADELQIARSSLQQYLKGEGNPSIRTIEQLAERMEMDPIHLLAGTTDSQCPEVAYTLFATLQTVGRLSKEDQDRFVDLFQEILQLCSK